MTPPTTVRSLLEATGITQGELARRSGINAGRISDYSNGKHTPSVTQMERMAHAAGMEMHVTFAPTDPDRWARAERVAKKVWRSMKLEMQEVPYEDLVWGAYNELSA
jgi:transcriptional regulator with XRE-family HTH domain